MAKKNNNGWSVLSAAVFFVLAFLNGSDEISLRELDEIQIVAKEPVHSIGSRKSIKEYRITSTAGNSFIITTAGSIASEWKIEDNIQANDTLDIRIRSSQRGGKIEDATIYSLRSPARVFYSIYEFNDAQKKLDRRWTILLVTIGVIFLLRGLKIISEKAAIIIGIVLIITAIVFRIFNIGY